MRQALADLQSAIFRVGRSVLAVAFAGVLVLASLSSFRALVVGDDTTTAAASFAVPWLLMVVAGVAHRRVSSDLVRWRRLLTGVAPSFAQTPSGFRGIWSWMVSTPSWARGDRGIHQLLWWWRATLLGIAAGFSAGTSVLIVVVASL